MAVSAEKLLPLDVVRGVEHELAAAGVPSPRVDAEILVGEALGVARSQLYSSRHRVGGAELERLRPLVARRAAREPLAYVLGEWGFRRLALHVDARALVPRPETEILVERCLEFLRGLDEPRVLDVGVGSGAVALAIADEHPGARVVGVDQSADALALARENVERLAAGDRIRLVEGDLLGGVEGTFDLVVSNPPYVTPEEYNALQPEIRRYEPREALVGVGIGQEIAAQARTVLRPGGRVALECGDGQAPDLAADLADLGYADVVTTPDLAGRARVVEATWPG
jgi:release factor glutamine methyltransferase